MMKHIAYLLPLLMMANNSIAQNNELSGLIITPTGDSEVKYAFDDSTSLFYNGDDVVVLLNDAATSTTFNSKKEIVITYGAVSAAESNASSSTLQEMQVAGYGSHGRTIHVFSNGREHTFDVTDNTKIIFYPPEPVIVPDEAIDLGLPSGTIWANRNIGADLEDDYGYYFMWGDTSNCITRNCVEDSCSTYGKTIAQWQGNITYDPAETHWSNEWQTPTDEQMRELVNECNWVWTSKTNSNAETVYGYEVRSKVNSNYIFLPASGSRNATGFYYRNSNGYYWSATPCANNIVVAFTLGFGSNEHYVGNYCRSNALPIRLVAKPSSDQP